MIRLSQVEVSTTPDFATDFNFYMIRLSHSLDKPFLAGILFQFLHDPIKPESSSQEGEGETRFQFLHDPIKPETGVLAHIKQIDFNFYMIRLSLR